MTLDNDTFHRPGNYWIGAGVIFVDDGDGERPLVETSGVTITIEAETVERHDGVNGPVSPVQSAVYNIRRRLNVATADVCAENLALLLGGSIETINTAPAIDISNPTQGRHYQITPYPMTMDSITVEEKATSTPLVEDTDYIVDAVNGRIQIITTGHPELTATPVVTSEISKVENDGAPVEHAVRFIPSELAGNGWSIYSPRALIRPLGSFEPKSRQWVTLPFEIELYSAVLTSRPT